MKTKSIVGLGFCGVDIIKAKNGDLLIPGGTCGNVISVLSSLNWNATILKKRNSDRLNDLANKLWNSVGVNVVEIGRTKYPLPRIVEIFDGLKNTQYSICPHCGRILLNIALPSKKLLSHSGIDFSCFDLFFFDRISDGTRYLLEIFKGFDRWTFYEPNSARNYAAWLENVASCDIVKFSDERISMKSYTRLVSDLNKQVHNTKIILITHSSRGFSYSISDGRKVSELTRVDVEQFTDTVDASGAGDWLSAGFIDKLTEYCFRPRFSVEEEIVVEALYCGHNLAKTASKHVGALGNLFINNETKLFDETYRCSYCKSDL